MTVDGTDEDKDSTTVSSSKSITSETTSGTSVTTTTTHISKVSSTNHAYAFSASFYFVCLSNIIFVLVQVVKSGSTETRVEKRIVITADSDADQDKVGPRMPDC